MCSGHSPSQREGRAGNQAGTEVKDVENAAYWPSRYHVFLYGPGPKNDSARSGLSLPISINKEKNSSQTDPQTNVIWKTPP